MDVVLKQDYPQLGFTGERVVVKNGFARNFLIPQGIAIEINKRNEKLLKNQLNAIEAQRIKLKSDAQALAERLQNENFEFTLKIGKKGKSFGSITARDILKAVFEKGYDLTSSQIILSESIKFVGDYEFSAKLHTEVTAIVPIKVLAEEAAETDDDSSSESDEEESSTEGGSEEAPEDADSDEEE